MKKYIYIKILMMCAILADTSADINSIDPFDKAITSTLLDKTIDPDSYILGPGDELDFLMVTSSNIINERLKISYLGDVMIPSVGKINIDNLTISSAFKLISKKCNDKIQNSSVEITLSKIKDFKVLVLGPNNIPSGYFPVNSSMRLVDLFDKIILLYDTQNSEESSINRISSRNIIIENSNRLNHFDLVSFKMDGDIEGNPYLSPEDIIKLDYIKNTVNIFGAIMTPGQYEYSENDNLEKLIAIAGGFQNNADLNNIEITRYKNPLDKEIILLNRDSFSSFMLMPDDDILIKPLTDYKLKEYVTIKGEVKNPGRYSIDSNITIKEIIDRSGGYSRNADSSKIILNNEIINNLGDRELNRILALDSDSRSDLDKSYMRARARSDRGGISNADFNVNSSLMSNYKLFDKDIIVIPKKYDFIEVIGAARNPGRYPFIIEKEVEDYIDMAGGVTGNSTSKYYIIQSGTGDRIFYKDFKGSLNSQDIIFIEEKNDYNSFDRFKDIIQITSQVLTILAVMNNLSQ
tara:strand:- start:38422 stop:39981 length:1560 start_codon:yes stop_codon:yes gene_type:complete